MMCVAQVTPFSHTLCWKPWAAGTTLIVSTVMNSDSSASARKINRISTDCGFFFFFYTVTPTMEWEATCCLETNNYEQNNNKIK